MAFASHMTEFSDDNNIIFSLETVQWFVSYLAKFMGSLG